MNDVGMPFTLRYAIYSTLISSRISRSPRRSAIELKSQGLEIESGVGLDQIGR